MIRGNSKDRISVSRSLMESSTNLVSINASLRLITLLLFLLPPVLGSATTACYSSIFSFGDSLADTGNLVHTLGRDGIRIGRPPYGMTYFHRPTGRFFDGRLIADFIAQEMGLPLLPPYLEETMGGDMRKGVNFAVGGATAMENGFFRNRGIHIKFTNVSLGDQIQWFKQFLPSLCSSSSACEDMLHESLVLMGAIGGNDYNDPFMEGRSLREIKSFVPRVVSTISSAIDELIELGARTLLVPGITPLGCNSAYLTYYRTHQAEDYDSTTGCLKWLNEFSMYHNGLLQAELQRLQQLHPHATIIYADYYGASMSIFSNPNAFGFGEEPLVACCGGGGPYNYNFSRQCGSEGSTVCGDPSRYVHWDGLHMTEATYRSIAIGLLHGPFAAPAIGSKCPNIQLSLHGDVEVAEG
ncbi:hypothetical protein C4D60_Mb01t06610 [Musa balbisiana]|uniref:Uncharacterized protein n=1 Tax=Musa balbisiana TaxID=52838 RepID=A0A4S8JKM2_MUSBA|nr:hypothetical protein C4D60_Mb01t06610 [Musa balbisiana]